MRKAALFQRFLGSSLKWGPFLGAAEGYYAVGLALRNPESEIVAFEADPEGRKLLRKMVGKNAVDHQVRIESYCTPQDLENALSGAQRALVVMDVEGGEEMLLNPLACPSLRHAEIIVELHEFIIPGIGRQLCERFATSHHIQEIPERDRTLDDLPLPLRHLARWLPKAMFMAALKEHRPARMSWLHLVPRASN